MVKMNQDLLLFVGEVLTAGFECISEGEHNPFVCFLDSDDERHMIKIEDTTGIIDASLVEDGREIIREFQNGQMYGLVWDGYVTTDGEKFDAVFVEAGRRGDKIAYVFAQKYKLKRRSKKVATDGPPTLVQDAKHLWKASKSRRK